MNLNNSVTHCVAADSKGSLSLSLSLCVYVFVQMLCMKSTISLAEDLIKVSCLCTVGFKFEAAKRHGDIIHYSWVLDCYDQKKLVCLQPK